MELINKAIQFAVKAHSGAYRKFSNTPYILHPLEVMTIAGTMTDDEEVLAAAVLHDTVEDAGITLAEIEKEFGKRVADLVDSETENKYPDKPAADTWRTRKEESLEKLKNAKDNAVGILWVSDKLSNLRAVYREWLLSYDAVWQNFNQKSYHEQKWYYESVAKLTENICHMPAWQEYNNLTILLFKRGVK